MGETPWSKYMGVPKIYFLVGKPTSKRYKGQHLRFKSPDDGKDLHVGLDQMKYLKSLSEHDFKEAKIARILEKWKTDDSKIHPGETDDSNIHPGETDLKNTLQNRVLFIQQQLNKYSRPQLPRLRAALPDEIIKEMFKKFLLSEYTSFGYTDNFNYQKLPYEFGSQLGNTPLFSEFISYYVNKITVEDFKIPAVTDEFISISDMLKENVSEYRQHLTMSTIPKKPLFDDRKKARYVPRIVESDNPALTYFRLEDEAIKRGDPTHPYFRLEDEVLKDGVRKSLSFMPSVITNTVVGYIFLH